MCRVVHIAALFYFILSFARGMRCEPTVPLAMMIEPQETRDRSALDARVRH